MTLLKVYPCFIPENQGYLYTKQKHDLTWGDLYGERHEGAWYRVINIEVVGTI